MRMLWFGDDGAAPDRERFAGLWRERFASEPPGDDRVERRLPRGMYDTPVAAFAGQWYFAHERLAQISSALDELGWAVTR
jgi:hypothetical protein